MHPANYKIGKQIVALYPISALAEALGRGITTIRMWERNGTIPPAAFRRGGKRLYTEQEISVAKRLADKTGVWTGGNPDWVTFTNQLVKAWDEIRENLGGRKHVTSPSRVRGGEGREGRRKGVRRPHV